MILDHRWFGVGRGAYEGASGAYRVTRGLWISQHAENFLADWLAEWGLPVAIIGLLALLWMLRPKRLGFLRHPLPTAAMIGIMALLLQNSSISGLEIAAVGLATFTVLGSLRGEPHAIPNDARTRAEKRAQNNGEEDSSPGREFQSGPIHDRSDQAFTQS